MPTPELTPRERAIVDHFENTPAFDAAPVEPVGEPWATTAPEPWDRPSDIPEF